jgi:integral membrane sensor domain MASE1
LAHWSIYRILWFTWWTGDSGGILILSPLFLAGHYQDKKFLEVAWSKLEAVLLLTAVVIISDAVFSEAVYFFHLPYILIPLVVWVAFRSNQIGTGLAILIILTVAIWHTINGSGLSSRAMTCSTGFLAPGSRN